MQAYAPVLLERKVVMIRKSMDEEKARGITIRTAMEATDRQCVRPSYVYLNICLYLEQLESRIHQSTRPPLQVIHIRTHNTTSWPLLCVYIWSPLSCVLIISLTRTRLPHLSVSYNHTHGVPRRVSRASGHCGPSLSRPWSRSLDPITDQCEANGQDV